jgi:Ankyrin repeats (3 copies)
MVQALVEKHGANIKAKDNEGYTALHLACRHGFFNVVQYLVEACEESHIAWTELYGSTNGETPLHVANATRQRRIVLYLMWRYPVQHTTKRRRSNDSTLNVADDTSAVAVKRQRQCPSSN